MRVIRMLLWIGLAIGVIVGGLSLYLYLIQDRLVFYPSSRMEMTPDEIGLQFEEVWIEVDEGERIHAWYFAGTSTNSDSDGNRPTVLFCHGNAGNISHRLQTVTFLLDQGSNILLFDYRGYGLSDGSPSEANVYADALAAFDWLIAERQMQASRVVVFGRSLGGAIASEVAVQRRCRGLVVESAFTSAVEMGQRMFPYAPIKWLAKHRLQTINRIALVGCPVLVTHSMEDEIIPYSMGCELFERAESPKRFVELFGGHNELEYFAKEEYRLALQEVLFCNTGGWVD